MNRRQLQTTGFLAFFLALLPTVSCLADDICTFAAGAGEVEPNIVLLIDSGAEMERIVPLFNNFTVPVAPVGAVDVIKNFVDTGANGNFFLNSQYGYSFVQQGLTHYLVHIKSDLTPMVSAFGLPEDAPGTYTWTINGRTITLPVDRSTVFVDGIKDNNFNSQFRYTADYLNYLFFGDYDVEGAGDGSDLPTKSNFYYAKQAMLDVARQTANKAQFGIWGFNATASGASNVQPLGMVVNEPLAADPADNNLDPNFENNINNMSTVNYSPLGEGLARIGAYFNSPSSGVVGESCQKQFVIVVSPGLSSEDGTPPPLSVPAAFIDHDGDAAGIGEGMIQELPAAAVAIPVNQNGSTDLDDVASYLFQNDIVGYEDGFQNVMTYTVGLMSNAENRLFLINTSNNGNGFTNEYDPTDLDYGDYHFDADDPEELSSKLLAAVNNILTRTNTFTAPVVPVTRTTSGDRIYMALFKPLEDTIFWEGDVVKLGLDSGAIIDKNGDAATHPSGALKSDYEPFWSAKAMADPGAANYISNVGRTIYTYLGGSTTLSADASNAFSTVNGSLTDGLLGSPVTSREAIINFVRGADVFDEDDDGNTTENREFIIGDVLHSEPVVVWYNSAKTMVYFGANDGMLHAFDDVTGIESWSFIPPNHLYRLKDMVEGSEHQIYIDSSPKIFFRDIDKDGDVDAGDGDKVWLVCGEREGGTGYFALDVTDPDQPVYMWRINREGAGGSLELENVIGAFADDEPLTITHRYAASDGGTSSFITYGSKLHDFTVGELVESWVAGTYYGNARILGVDELSSTTGILEIDTITGIAPFYPGDNLRTSERIASVDGSLFDFLRYAGATPDEFVAGETVTGALSGHTATIDAVTTLAPGFEVLELGGATGVFLAGEDLEVSGEVATADSGLFDFLRFDNQTELLSAGDVVTGVTSGDSATIVSLPGSNIMEVTGSANTFVDNETLIKVDQHATAASNQLSNALYYHSQMAARHFDPAQQVVGRTSGATADIANIIEISPNTGILELTNIVGVFQNGEDLYNPAAPVMGVAGSRVMNVAVLYDNQLQVFTPGDIVMGATSLTYGRVISEPESGVLELNILPPGPPRPFPLSPLVDNEPLMVVKNAATTDGTLQQGAGLYFTLLNGGSFEAGDTVTGLIDATSATVVSVAVADTMLEVSGVAGGDGDFAVGEGLSRGGTRGTVDTPLVQNVLRYDDQVGAFTVGGLVRGGASGATATLDSITVLGAASGFLRLSGIVGVFEDNEGLVGGGGILAATETSFPFYGLRYEDLTYSFLEDDVIRGEISGSVATVTQSLRNETSFMPVPVVFSLTGSTGIVAIDAIPAGADPYTNPAPPVFFGGEDIIANTPVNAATADGILDGTTLEFDNQTNSFSVGGIVTGTLSGATADITSVVEIPAPTLVIPQLGYSWAEPQFGRVKTTDLAADPGTAVFVIGGGFDDTNATGKAVLVMNVEFGTIVRMFSGHGSMNYAIPSTVAALDTSGNGFLDKIYVGDTGGQLWRIGGFYSPAAVALPFPSVNENINSWSETVLYTNPLPAAPNPIRKYFYQPSVTLEHGFDMVFSGTGDRDNACEGDADNTIHAVMDTNFNSGLVETDLADIGLGVTPDLGGAHSGWFLDLAPGEKVLSEGLVFFKIYYVTTFTPYDDPCTLGGIGKLYALNHLTGGPTIYPGYSETIGSGIPSKPVLVIPDEPETPYLFISVADTDPTDPDDPGGAGIDKQNPDFEAVNFKYLWWRDWTE